MTDNKPSYKSETIIGVVIAVVGPIVTKYGYTFDASIVNDIITLATALVGGIIAIHGRITARSRVTLL